MNKKLIIFGLALLLISSAVPVMGASLNKVEITANVLNHHLVVPPKPVTMITGDITHWEVLTLAGDLQINIGEETISCTYVDTITGIDNPDSNKGVYQWDEVWTLPNGDTFAGTAHVNLVGSLMKYTEFDSHIILHGTGSYEGQILSLNMHFINPGGTSTYTGYWLKP